MKSLKTPFMIILFLCATIVGWIILLNLTMQSTILNIGYYSQQIDQHKLYELPKNHILLLLKENSTAEIPTPVTTSLQNALDKSFPPDWTKAESTIFLRHFIDYLKGYRDKPDFTVDLSDRKTMLEFNLTSELQKLKPEELALYSTNNQDPQQVSRELVHLINLPDKIYYKQTSYLQSTSAQHFIVNFQKYYRYSTVLPYILLLLIALLFYAIIRSPASFKWLGNSMLVAGVLLIMAMTIFNGAIEESMMKYLSSQQELLMITATNPLVLATLFKNNIAGSVYLLAVIYSMIGVAISILGNYLIKTNMNNSASDTAPIDN